MTERNAEIKDTAETVAEAKHGKKKTCCKVTDDMLICFAITFTASMSCYMGNMPEKFTYIYKIVIFVLMIFTWLWASFRNGMKNKWPFAIFAVLFMLVPQVITLLYDKGPEAFGMSITMYILSEFSNIVWKRSFDFIGELLKFDNMAFTLFFIIICAICYLLGMFVSIRRRPNKN